MIWPLHSMQGRQMDSFNRTVNQFDSSPVWLDDDATTFQRAWTRTVAAMMQQINVQSVIETAGKSIKQPS